MGLDEWRARIDEIDRQLLGLLNQRAELSLEIGRAKRESGESVLVPEREQGILDELARLNPGPLAPGRDSRDLGAEVLSASRVSPATVPRGLPRSRREPTRIWPPSGTSARAPTSCPPRGIAEVFEEVKRGRAEVGVVPIENSSEGVVNHTLDGLIDSELLICGEVSLEIHHHLLSRAADLGDIKRVFSHPQALGPCRGWLTRHLPDAEVVEMASTSAAAEQAALDPGDRGDRERAGRPAPRDPRSPRADRGLREQRDAVPRHRAAGHRADRPGQDVGAVLHS